MLYLATILLSFSAVLAIGLTVVSIIHGHRQRYKALTGDLTALSKLSATEQELARPFTDRVLVPGTRSLARLGRRLSPLGLINHYKHQIVLSGEARDLSLDKFLSLKVLCVILALIVCLLASLSGQLPLIRLLSGAMIFSVLAFFLPDFWLNSKVNERQKAIRLALPDTLDLLMISVEAGLGFDGALSKVVKNSPGPLSEEFYRMLKEMQLGITRHEALKNLNQRTDVPELNSFVLAMLQADVFGISIGKVLHIQAHEMRSKRRQQAEEIAMKAPVKIVFPLILCIFPALLVVILGPAVINIYQAIIGKI